MCAALGSNCWLWTGGTNWRPVPGQPKRRKRKKYERWFGHLRWPAVGIKDWPTSCAYAHHVSYYFAHGVVAPDHSKDLVLAHLCPHRLCVRPEHLELMSKGASNHRDPEGTRRARAVELYAQRLLPPDIAHRLGCAPPTVIKDLKATGVYRSYSEERTQRRDALAELFHQNSWGGLSESPFTLTCLAQHYTVTTTTIHKDLKVLGYLEDA